MPKVCWTTDKPIYTEEEAEEMVYHVFKKYGRVVRAYSCRFCGQYHLTHNKLRKKYEEKNRGHRLEDSKLERKRFP